MGMDKTLFKQKLDKVGYFKRKWAGATPQDEDAWEERVLKLFPKEPTCPDCHTIDYWAKMDGKGKRIGWWKKCYICKEKVVIKSPFTK